jgi:mono/diheme cytochrome c family protein
MPGIKEAVMKKSTILLMSGALAIAGASLYGQGKGAGDAAKGKSVFEDNCAVCHNADNTEAKMGPGLKGLFKRDKLKNGKPVNDANVMAQIENGGNGMPAYKDLISDTEKANVLAYLKTL